MSDAIRIAVIGIGHMGTAHARCIHSGAIAGARLAAVCDTNPDRLAWAEREMPEALRFPDYHQLITSSAADAVIIAVPHPLHSLIAREALGAGLHALSEKPLDIRVSDARKAVEAGKEADNVFAVMLNQRTNPIFQRARDIVASGELGQLKRSVWIITNWYRTQHYYDSGDWRASWRGEGGGVLLNQAPHNLDLWQWICGMPVEMTAQCDLAKYHHIEVEDEATLFVRYANGATGCFITSTGESPGTNRLEISGTRGKLVLEEGKLRRWQLREDEEMVRFSSQVSFAQIPYDYSEWIPDTEPTAHAGILQNFTNAILKGEPLLSPAEDGLNELTLSNAAYLSSWEGGRPVALPLDEARFDELLAQRQAESKVLGAGQGITHDITGEYSHRWQTNW
ncbi:MAG: Gfo/Idh/MocA family oxidoreductase [Clostridia bacterium]|nr:Gfo/Idh/MocA family oxidoreductase [Clostridia bacterium]